MIKLLKNYSFVFAALLTLTNQASANDAAQKLFSEVNVKTAGKAKMTDDKFVAYLTVDSDNKAVMVFEIHPHANINTTGKIHTTTASVVFNPRIPCFQSVLKRNAFKGRMGYFNGAKVNACNQLGRVDGERYIAAKARHDNGWRLGLLQ